MDSDAGRQAQYIARHLQEVKHITLNPDGPGVVRIHMIPPVRTRFRRMPPLVILNGQDILPINWSWAVLLSCFMDAFQPFDGREVTPDDWDGIVEQTMATMRAVYTRVEDRVFRDDLRRIIDTFTAIARGEPPAENIGVISLKRYARYMRAPHRMDLLISAMVTEQGWQCNQRCLHCYAAGQPMAAVKELTTAEWKRVIDRCREAGIPQLTFTGGEPTLREDLPELVAYASWFVTRVNTNGVLLTESLCRRLADASLDSVQITLYSADLSVHNALVGADKGEATLAGIRNALAAGLSVSINTPLCTRNRDYVSTLHALHEMGVQYVSCSGLIPAGNAQTDASLNTRLSSGELADILKNAAAFCAAHGMEISFTSPGWLDEATLRQCGMPLIPSCGACLSNMAVAPDGSVIPCQSWLSEPPLGNLLTDDWRTIWNGDACRRIRKVSARMEQTCQLRTRPSGKEEGRA